MASSDAGCGAGAAGRLPSVALLLLAVLAMAAPSSAAVYKVGDSTGWTVVGNYDYGAWAASKTFRVGDTVVFNYNKQFHNVMEVSQADYASCSSAAPESTYATGNDSVTLKTAGHHYFLCGVQGHCAVGQKVDIHVLAPGTAAPAPLPATPPARAHPSAPGPSPTSSPPSPPTAAGGPAASISPKASAAGSPAGNVVSCFLALLVAAICL